LLLTKQVNAQRGIEACCGKYAETLYNAEILGWSSSVPNLSGKLRRGSLRYTEAVELADVLGYDLVWQKRREVR
jgi:hypothetical protein